MEYGLRSKEFKTGVIFAMTKIKKSISNKEWRPQTFAREKQVAAEIQYIMIHPKEKTH